MKCQRLVFSLLIFLFAVVIVGCDSRGTGFSENEVYLSLLSTDESLGIVLESSYYLLPEPLYRFIENGWEEGILHQYGALEDIMLPPGTYMRIRLDHGDMRLDLNVVNNEGESIDLLEGTVISLHIRGAEKDQAVIVGGVTINTSYKESSERLQELSIDYRRIGLSRIHDEHHYEGQMTIYSYRNVVTGFRIELGTQYAVEHYTRYRTEEFINELLELETWFIANAYYFEGTVIGIYDVEVPVGNDDTMTAGETIVSRDSDGNLFATLRDHRINLEDIRYGDRIKVYYSLTEHRGSRHELIQYEDGSRIPYIRAEVLVINDDIHFSTYRR